MNKRILLVEDDPAVASLIQKTLDEEQYEVSVAMDGSAGWDYISRFTYDLLIFDVMLPHISGMELCKRTRQQNIRTPILMLTALGSVDNIVMGLDAGADDYQTKPFRIAELLARVRSLLRRQPSEANVQPPDPNTPTTKNIISFQDLILNLDEKNASLPGQTIDLTATEFRLLEYFLRNPRRVLSRMDILESVWGYEVNLNTKVVDVYVNYLRKKLESPGRPRFIQTVVGMGYILKDE